MEIKGKVVEVSATMQIKETFRKRELIVEYIESNPSYPEYIKFEAIQDKCELLDAAKVGDEVEVFFNLRGRPWTDKNGKKQYFNSLVLWRLNVLNGQSTAEGVDEVPDYVQFDQSKEEGSDDLPF